MTPYFGARLPNGTWTIQLTEGGVVRGTANIVVDDANPLYWIGNRTDVRSAWRALVVAMLAVPGATGVYDLSFSSTDAEAQAQRSRPADCSSPTVARSSARRSAVRRFESSAPATFRSHGRSP